jgi:hypothetical protein
VLQVEYAVGFAAFSATARKTGPVHHKQLVLRWYCEQHAKLLLEQPFEQQPKATADREARHEHVHLLAEED